MQEVKIQDSIRWRLGSETLETDRSALVWGCYGHTESSSIGYVRFNSAEKEIFSSSGLELWLMNLSLTYELDLDRVMVNRRAKYLGQRSFYSTVIMRTHRHRQQSDCNTWTTKWSIASGVKLCATARGLKCLVFYMLLLPFLFAHARN